MVIRSPLAPSSSRRRLAGRFSSRSPRSPGRPCTSGSARLDSDQVTTSSRVGSTARRTSVRGSTHACCAVGSRTRGSTGPSTVSAATGRLKATRSNQRAHALDPVLPVGRSNSQPQSRHSCKTSWLQHRKGPLRTFGPAPSAPARWRWRTARPSCGRRYPACRGPPTHGSSLCPRPGSAPARFPCYPAPMTSSPAPPARGT